MIESIPFNTDMWTISDKVSATLVLASLAITVAVMIRTLKIKKHASNNGPTKGLFSISVVALLSYAAVVYALLKENGLPPGLVTGCMIFLGACWYHIIVRILFTFIKTLSHEIAKRKSLESRANKLSLIDELTGLYNYRGFLNLIEHHLRLAKRDKNGIMVFYADIHNLEMIKEKLGHEEAKLMVLETSKLLKYSFRTSDIIARVNESEFMVFLIGTTKENADAVTANFEDNLSVYNAKRNKKYHLPIHYCSAPYNPVFNQIFDNIHAQANDFLSEIQRAKKEAYISNNSPVEPESAI